MIFLSKTLLNLPPKFRWRPQKFSPKAVMVARAFRVKRHIHTLWPYRFSELFSCTLSRPFFICSDELTYEAFGGCIKSCSANNVGIGVPELKSPSGFGRLLKLADLWMVLGASELHMPPNQKVPNLLHWMMQVLSLRFYLFVATLTAAFSWFGCLDPWLFPSFRLIVIIYLSYQMLILIKFDTWMSFMLHW